VDKVIQGGVLMSTSTADLQVCVHHRKAIGCLECAELKPSEPFCRWHVQKGLPCLNSAHSSEPCGNQLPLADSENQWRAMDQLIKVAPSCTLSTAVVQDLPMRLDERRQAERAVQLPRAGAFIFHSSVAAAPASSRQSTTSCVPLDRLGSTFARNTWYLLFI